MYNSGSKENRPLKPPSITNMTILNSVAGTIKTDDLSQTIPGGTGELGPAAVPQENGGDHGEDNLVVQCDGGYTEYFTVGCGAHGQLGHPQGNADPSNSFLTTPKSLSFDILIA